jgi:hypothetical protein
MYGFRSPKLRQCYSDLVRSRDAAGKNAHTICAKKNAKVSSTLALVPHFAEVHLYTVSRCLYESSLYESSLYESSLYESSLYESSLYKRNIRTVLHLLRDATRIYSLFTSLVLSFKAGPSYVVCGVAQCPL